MTRAFLRIRPIFISLLSLRGAYIHDIVSLVLAFTSSLHSVSHSSSLPLLRALHSLQLAIAVLIVAIAEQPLPSVYGSRSLHSIGTLSLDLILPTEVSST